MLSVEGVFVGGDGKDKVHIPLQQIVLNHGKIVRQIIEFSFSQKIGT